MRVDSFGVLHPTQDDEPNLVGILHIAECGECQKRWPLEVVSRALQVGDVYDKERLAAARHVSSRAGSIPARPADAQITGTAGGLNGAVAAGGG